MTELTQTSRTASLRRTAIMGIGAFILLLFAGAVVLWAKLGTAVFFEVVAAGIAYCF